MNTLYKTYFTLILAILNYAEMKGNSIPVVPITSIGKNFDLSKFSEMYIADINCANIDSFLNKNCVYTFEKVNSNSIRGEADKVTWVHFFLRNEDTIALKRFIEINMRSIEFINLYEVQNGKVIAHQKTGALEPAGSKNTLTGEFHLSITLLPYQSHEFYLSLNNRYNSFSTFIHIESDDLSESACAIRTDGTIVGLASAYVIFSFFMFLYMRRSLYFYYFLYTMSDLLYLVSTSWFGGLFIWHKFPAFDRIADSVFGACSGLSFILLTLSYFKVRTVFPKIFSALKIAVFFIGAALLCEVFEHYLPGKFIFSLEVVSGFSFLFTLLMALHVAIKSYLESKNRENLFFLIGFSSFISCSFLLLFSEFGLMNRYLFVYKYFPIINLFVEMTVGLYLLGSRIKNEIVEGHLKEFALLKQMQTQREQISRDLHDDIGSTLNSISVYSEVARRQIHNTHPQSGTILENIGESARQLIGSMNDIVWAINPENDEFENITERMRFFAAQLIMTQDITLQFEADARLNEVNLSIEQRKNFYLILKEAVNNVYKYAGCKTLSVKIQQKNGNIEMQITDDGCGFDCKNCTGGNGMKTMKHRAEKLTGTLKINSEIGKGTELNLTFPIQEIILTTKSLTTQIGSTIK